MENIYYTIGHSNHHINDFLDILIHYKIKLVVDVRSLPGSNKNPQFNQEELINYLQQENIKYKHLKNLGGLRKSNNKINSNINSFWQNKSFLNYANYTMSDELRKGLNELIKLGTKYRCVIMCAEVLWWRCHLSDYN